jgi:hypothetical protein
MRQVTLSDEEMGIQAYWRHGFFFWFASSGAFLAFVYLLTDAICKQNTIQYFLLQDYVLQVSKPA